LNKEPLGKKENYNQRQQRHCRRRHHQGKVGILFTAESGNAHWHRKLGLALQVDERIEQVIPVVEEGEDLDIPRLTSPFAK
jgi:hypothetical protein